jgi:hypothetical protein
VDIHPNPLSRFVLTTKLEYKALNVFDSHMAHEFKPLYVKQNIDSNVCNGNLANSLLPFLTTTLSLSSDKKFSGVKTYKVFSKCLIISLKYL